MIMTSTRFLSFRGRTTIILLLLATTVSEAASRASSSSSSHVMMLSTTTANAGRRVAAAAGFGRVSPQLGGARRHRRLCHGRCDIPTFVSPPLASGRWYPGAAKRSGAGEITSGGRVARRTTTIAVRWSSSSPGGDGGGGRGGLLSGAAVEGTRQRGLDVRGGGGGSGGGGDGSGGGDTAPSSSVNPPSESGLLLATGAQGVVPFVKGLGAVVAGGAALLLGMLYLNQERLLYIPEIDGIPRNNRDNPPGYQSPAEYGLPYEETMIKTDDGVSIHSWLVLHPQSRERRLPTIIFFHGNAGNIGIRLPNAQQMYEVLNANVLMVEYRGYGDSDDASRPSERGLYLDAEAAFRFARSHPSVDPSRIFVFGRSLGGAVGFHVARYAEENGVTPPLAGLIVENTFVSVDRMVDVVLPFLSPVKGLFLRMHYDSGKIAPTVRVPVLYVAGDADEIVPYDHMKELFAESEKSSVLARMHVVKGGTHNETWLQGGKAYWQQMRKFMSDVLSLR